MLDVRVLPVANAHCKPERDEKGSRWVESRFRPGSTAKFPGTRSRIHREFIDLKRPNHATRDHHIKWSQSEGERQIPCDITYTWNLKIWYKWTYLWNRNRLTDTENRLVVAKGEGVEGGMEWEVGGSRCKLYIQDGWTTRSCCRAQGTIFHILW